MKPESHSGHSERALKKHLRDLLTRLGSHDASAVAPSPADFEKEITLLATQFGFNAPLLSKVRAKPDLARAFLTSLAAYAQRLEMTIKGLRAELSKYRTPELITELREAAKKDPKFWQRLRADQNAKLSLAQRKRRAQRHYDITRSGEFAAGPGLIEKQFAAPGVVIPTLAGPPIRVEDCLDDLLRGGQVKTHYLQLLFHVNRKRFPKRLVVKQGRESFYDYRAFIQIAEHLLVKGLWLQDAGTRHKVLMGIQQRTKNIAGSKKILSAVKTFVKRASSKLC
jgi:hypothetical protein